MNILSAIGAASVLAFVAAGAAQAATEVEVRDVAARVVVIPEDRADVDLRVKYGKDGLPVVMVRTQGNKLIADGKLKRRRMNCEGNGAVSVSGVGHFSSSELPVITIRVPKNAKVSVGGAVYGEIGKTASLDFAHGGCGGWTIGDTGNAEISVGGSGDVKAGKTQALEVNIGGSGSVSAQSATTLEANIGGNGDVVVNTVNGPIEVNIGGSGNVTVGEGNSPSVSVSIAGSGDVRFAGTAKDVEVSIVGSGDVRIRNVTGNVSKSIMGSGNILIGQ